MLRTVSSSLTAQVEGVATVELQVAVAGAAEERLHVSVDGREVLLSELPTEAGGRLHTGDVGPGTLEVRYDAVVQGRAAPAPVLATDASVYRRPSRYAESDRLAAVAQAELGHLTQARALLPAAASLVGSRLAYVAGSSRGTDGAVDTLLAGAGVCRDHAHLLVALLRARDVPARLVSVYAPGLAPMDFHAVVEALVDGAWLAADATLLAPRGTLLRIATGRDAADTAFLTSYGAAVRLERLHVTATSDGDLPDDDLDASVALG